MKRYTKKKKKILHYDTEFISKLLIKAKVFPITEGPVLELKVDSFCYNHSEKRWEKNKRDVITFKVDDVSYDVLMPECQVINIHHVIDGLKLERTKELNKIIFGNFKKTKEYYAIPKELRMES